MEPLPLLSPQNYTVAWLCALAESELIAARKMLDHGHKRPRNQNIHDDNSYFFGDMNGHNIVIACLPPGMPGTVSAQRLVAPLKQSFPNLQIHLFVGIGGGVPRNPIPDDPIKDIHLGDVVVGWAEQTGAPAVVQFDFVRWLDSGKFELLGHLDNPNRRLLSALNQMLSDRGMGEEDYDQHLQRLADLKGFQHPGLNRDVLYQAPEEHVEAAATTCADCIFLRRTERKPRQTKDLVWHQGTILSGNAVMKNAKQRDTLSRLYHNAICFEMEAAGMVNDIHCLVIRGISDYADSHKNSEWQKYASATAAAFARGILYAIQPALVDSVSHEDNVLPAARTAEEAALLQTLASDYKTDKDFVARRIDGTCEWFFQDERFTRWRDSCDSSLLWVSAGPGCGKSVLSRALIDERRVSTSTLTSTVCYWFFKDGQQQRMHGVNALCAIIHQLFSSTALATHGLAGHKNHGRKLAEMFSELWEILMRSAKDAAAGEIVCVIDALDECDEKSRTQLIDKLIGFFSSKGEDVFSSCCLKFLVTSRPYDDLESNFRHLSGNNSYLRFDGDEKSEQISREINLVIDVKVGDFAHAFSPHDQKRIAVRLKEMEHCTYLWFFLTVDIIERSRSRYAKASGIEKLLSDLPSEVSDAYEMILRKSRGRDKVVAQKLLQIIVAAKRPLNLQEANIALTMATQEPKCATHDDLDLWPERTFASFVKNLCGLLVTVHNNTLSLLHQTVREFLTKKPTESVSPAPDQWQGCFDVASAHGILSRLCLEYLNLEDLGRITSGYKETVHLHPYNYQKVVLRSIELNTSGSSNAEAASSDESDPEIDRILQRCLFLVYAAENWASHYVLQDEISRTAIQNLAGRLCDFDLVYSTYWMPLYGALLGVCLTGFNKTGVAAYLGLADLVKQFLDEGEDPQAVQRDDDWSLDVTALTIAARQGYSDVTRVLLEKGADRWWQNSMGEDALRLACENSHLGVVEQILESNVDIDQHTESIDSALIEASFKGPAEIVELLVGKGAKINAESDAWFTPLSAASSCGHKDIVQFLIRKGADVNAQDGWYGSALQLASEYGEKDIVQFLIDGGADVNAQGGQYGSALQMALRRNYQDVVKILKENGAIDVGGIYDADNREHSSEDGAEPMTGKRSADDRTESRNKTLLLSLSAAAPSVLSLPNPSLT